MSTENTHICPVERAGGLESRVRKWFQNPRKILGPYVKEGMTVLDVGCGPGFFSKAMADMVGESGQVIAADLQEGMLQRMRDKIEGKPFEKRVTLHKCEEDRIGISEEVDFALAFYMVHEVPNRKDFLGEVRSILKPNGRFLMVEPRFLHVSKRQFEDTIGDAGEIGFEVVERPKIFLSRAVVLRS